MGPLALLAAVLVSAPLIPKPAAPDVRLTLIDGASVRLAESRGQVVLVSFWATTCVTCVRSMPQLAATHRRFAARGYQTFAVAMQYDRPDWVINYSMRNRLPFPIALDVRGDIARAFGDTRVTPATFLIDAQGRIVGRFVGEPDVADLQQRIENLLSG